MADQEVIKHGQKIIRLAGSKEHTLPHKLREIAIEFFTIVFAVSLSIWLHGLSEHHHQQQEVRVFLAGLRTDLKNDIDSIRELKRSYRDFNANFAYLAALDPKQMPDEAEFAKVVANSNTNHYFRPYMSRYEGFRSSGKIAYIEDQALLDAIFELYQMALPQIRSSEGGWGGRQEKLRAYQDAELESDDLAEHFRVFTSLKGKRLVKWMMAPDQIFIRYDNYGKQAEAIVKAIERAYPELAQPQKG
jgi:hypothetical protein